jgi:hypothetical protein
VGNTYACFEQTTRQSARGNLGRAEEKVATVSELAANLHAQNVLVLAQRQENSPYESQNATPRYFSDELFAMERTYNSCKLTNDKNSLRFAANDKNKIDVGREGNHVRG